MKQLTRKEARIVDKASERIMDVFEKEIEELDEGVQFALAMSIVDKVTIGYDKQTAMRLLDGLKNITAQRSK